MKNICIVGYGSIGPVHCDSIKRTENINLYAVCDTNRIRADKAAAEYDCKAYYDFNEMLKDKNIDSVHICTPHYLHYEMIKKTVLSGRDAVVEKPVTMKREEFEDLLKNYSDKRICVMFQNRTNDSIATLKEMIAGGKCGELLCARAFLTWKRTAEYYNADEWRGTIEYEGGGVLINQSVHMLDMLTFLCGNVKSVKSSISNRTIPEIEVEDTAEAVMEFENGASGIFYATNAYATDSPFFVELTFTGGTYRYIDGRLYKDGEFICDDKGKSSGKAYWGSGHKKVIDAFYNGGNYPTLQSAASTMRTVFEIYGQAGLV